MGNRRPLKNMEDRDLSTTQAAKLCRVSSKKVIDWCRDGMLKYYLLPGSKYRRIPRKYLAEFIQHYGLPIPKELEKYAITSPNAEKQGSKETTQGGDSPLEGTGS